MAALRHLCGCRPVGPQHLADPALACLAAEPLAAPPAAFGAMSAGARGQRRRQARRALGRTRAASSARGCRRARRRRLQRQTAARCRRSSARPPRRVSPGGAARPTPAAARSAPAPASRATPTAAACRWDRTWRCACVRRQMVLARHHQHGGRDVPGAGPAPQCSPEGSQMEGGCLSGGRSGVCNACSCRAAWSGLCLLEAWLQL